MNPASFSRLQGGLAALLVLGSLASLAHLALRSPDVAFLPPGGDDGWIGFGFPVTAGVVRTPQPPPPFVFERRFALASVPARARLEVQALHRVELVLNGEPVFPGERRAWRTPLAVDVAGLLRPGLNTMEARVRRPLGPGLLRIRTQDVPALASDERWSVTPPGGTKGAASLADDTHVHPRALLAAEPVDLLRGRAAPLLLILALATGLAYALATERAGPVRRRLGLAVPVAISLGWAALLATRLAGLPLSVGFDAHGHLDYVRFVRESGALPLATQGFSMYHPPLFYVLTAGLTAALRIDEGDPGAGFVYRLIPMAAGLASVWAVWGAARRLFAGDALRTGLATAIAGLLPMHLIMASYVSNESLSTAAASGLLALAVGLLLAERASVAAWAGLAALAGLGLLTKYSGFALAPLVLGITALRAFAVDRRSLGRAVGVGAGLGAGALALGGWFYARSWWAVGTPFPWNREAGGPGLWWHLPGFHTLDFFGSFGESLRHPLFAGFRSYGDGVYSTLWGDGLAAGVADPLANPGGWHLDWMLLGYAPALPVTLLLALGILRAARSAVRDASLRRRMAWSLLLAVLWTFGFLHLSFAIRYPSYAASKAFYALPALLPGALVGALGLAWPAERLAGEGLRPLRALYLGALLTFGAVLVLGFRG